MNKFLYICASTTLMAATALPPAMAQDNGAITAIEAEHKVNIAGRQRMLSQRMAKAACLMAQDISFASAYDQLTQAYNLYQRSADGLRAGNADMGLVEEQFPDVLEALTAVDGPWSDYSAVLAGGIEDGSIESTALEQLDNASLDVLKKMNIAVFKTARAYAEVTDKVPLGLTITIDVAGRQRMLTQKAVKEACLMSLSADPLIHADRLAETIEVFDLSLNALRDGYEDVGVIAAPTREIDRKLIEVLDLWEPVKTILDRAAEGETLSKRELSRVARLSEPLLRTMNEAVDLYEGAEQSL